jgi:hypothetical protein
MPYIEIKNKKEVQKKYQYTDYTGSHPLPPEFIADQKRRSLKYTKKGGN